MSENTTELSTKDALSVMNEGRSLRGEPILTLAKGEMVKVELLSISKSELKPSDDKDMEWVGEQIKKLQKRGMKEDYLPILVMKLKTLEKFKDKDGADQNKGLELDFQRPVNNSIWDTFEKAVKDFDEGVNPTFKIFRAPSGMGNYVIIPS